MGKKIIIIFINLTGQNRGLSGLKSIWPVIMTGDLLSIILSLAMGRRVPTTELYGGDLGSIHTWYPGTVPKYTVLNRH